jgi:tetratricopeptide (TPR) repeat protein
MVSGTDSNSEFTMKPILYNLLSGVKMQLNAEQILQSTYELALTFYEEEEFDSAIKTLEKLPTTVDTANLLGCCHAELMNPVEAEKAYLQAIENNSKDPTPWHNLAMLYDQFFQPFEAKQAYEKLFKLKSDDVVALFEYACVLLQLNMEDEAYDVLKKAHQLDPYDECVIINLAVILCHKKQRPRIALRMLKSALAISPMDAELLYHVAITAWDMGEELTCLQARDILCPIDPEKCAELDERTGRQNWN